MNTLLCRQQIIGKVIFLGANFQGDIVRGQLLINFPGQILIFREQLSGVTFLGGICPGGQFSSGAVILLGNYLVCNNQEEAGNHPGVNCSGEAIFLVSNRPDTMKFKYIWNNTSGLRLQILIFLIFQFHFQRKPRFSWREQHLKKFLIVREELDGIDIDRWHWKSRGFTKNSVHPWRMWEF